MPPETPITLASDVHLRPDHPDRGRRLARVVEGLAEGERLILAGDVCDFWFASRSRLDHEPSCPGLKALARLVERGGELTILLGNHDAWLADYYRERLGARVVEQATLDFTAQGTPIHVAHGHLLGARPVWKGAMESRAFLAAFRALPVPAANAMARLLDRSNQTRLDADNRRHLAVFRRYADAHSDRAALFVFGHAHLTVDDTSRRPRLVVLGDWKDRASYLRIDERGIRQVVIHDEVVAPDLEATY